MQVIENLTQRQQKQEEYIEKLENSVISLPEEDDSSEEH